MAFREKYGPWAIVAGASEGTGRSFARKLAEQGVSCLLIALDGPLEEVAEEVRGCGVECVTARIDLSRPDAADRVVAAASGPLARPLRRCRRPYRCRSATEQDVDGRARRRR